MKKILVIILLAFIHPVWGQNQCVLPAQNANCPPQDISYPYGACFADVEKYLAKAISGDWLTHLNANWGWNNTNGNGCNDPLPGYCPQKYCEDINMFVELDAKLIWTVTGLWGSESWMVPGTPYYTAAANSVLDINKAYDCAGKMRPIIQAAILENISDDVNQITVPLFVKNAFQNDPDYPASYYNSNTRKFNRLKIAHLSGGNIPDLSRIEARMWFYYLGKTYIDMGYKDLHMGNINVMIDNDNGLVNTYYLFTKLRDYASSINSFVLIDAHVNHNLYLQNTNLLLLDYNSGPIRPIETALPISSNCAGNLSTVIIPSQGEIYNIYDGGISPTGCLYPRTPFLAVWDHYSGICGIPGQNDPNSWCVWGYDEKRWFNTLSDDCQADWIKFNYYNLRNIYYRGFLQMPGRLTLADPNWNNTAYYRVNEHPIVMEAIKEAWEANTNLDYTSQVSDATIESLASDERTVICTKKRKFTLNVVDPDCSSIYTWHVQKPDGSWLPHSYGSQKEFYTCDAGEYKIGLRQENLVYQGATPGTKGINKFFTVNYDINYCDPHPCGIKYIIEIYPVPAGNEIHINFTNPVLDNNYYYKIINKSGVIEIAGAISTFPITTINTTNLNSDIYYLNIIDKNNNLVYNKSITIVK